MATPRNLIEDFILLFEDTLPSIPEATRGLLNRQFLRLKERHEEVSKTTSFSGGGSAAYWQHYRATQKFQVIGSDDCAQDDPIYIVGWDALVEFTGFRPNTLRQRLAQGRGTLSIVQDGNVLKIVRIDK
jgi:hypothetical protein